MAAQTDRLLGRAQGPGSAHSTDPPPQFHWEAITLTSWHSLHSSWVRFFARASRRVKPEKTRKRPTTGYRCSRRRPDAPKGSRNEQLAREKGYFDMQKTHKACCVLCPNKNPWKNKKNINQKTHFCVAFACKVFRLFLLSINPEELQSQIILPI